MKDTLREECESSDDCLRNCCVSPYFAPLFFVVFVLMAQFVLVNVVVAVLMKHLEESHKQVRSRLSVSILIFLPHIFIGKGHLYFIFIAITSNGLRYEMDSFTVFFKNVFTSHVIIWCIFILKCPCLLFYQTAKVELDIVFYNLSSHFNKTICQTFVKANIC